MVSEEDEKAALEREIAMLDRQIEKSRYSYTPPNPYKTVLLTLFGILGIGSFGLLLWLVGRKSKKDKCRCDV